jgi:hypothetical protein
MATAEDQQNLFKKLVREAVKDELDERAKKETEGDKTRTGKSTEAKTGWLDSLFS